MKPKLAHILAVAIIFSSLSIHAQTKRLNAITQALSPLHVLLNQTPRDINVISIINPENSKELVKLDELAQKYQSDKVGFIAITDEVNDSIVNSLKYQLIHYQYLASEQNEMVFNHYQTGTFKIFPMQIITDSNGEILYLKKGAVKNIEDKLVKKIDKLLLIKSEKEAEEEIYYSLN